MKIRTIARLDLLAATSEAKIRDEIGRLSNLLAQITQQRSVLATYRNRLIQSWRDGDVVPAATAQRAGHFVAMSHNADAQIDQYELETKNQISAAWELLIAIQERRLNLKAATESVIHANDVEAERRRDREFASQRSARPRTTA